MRKKLLSVVLALVMVLSWLPAALAVTVPGNDSGITTPDQFAAALGESNVSQSVEQWTPNAYVTPPVPLPVFSLEQDIIVEGANFRVKGSFILDLNGHTLDMGPNALISDDNAQLILRSSRDGGKITGNSHNGVLRAENQGYLELTYGTTGYGITITGNNNTGIVAKDNSKVHVAGAVIEDTDQGIIVMGDAELNCSGGGTRITSSNNAITTNNMAMGGPVYENPKILIEGNTMIESKNGAGLYLSAVNGDASVYSGTIRGKTGIEIRAGSLYLGADTYRDIIIEGGDSEGASTGQVASNTGSMTQNAGIGVVPYSGSAEEISVTIQGGTIRGSAALYQDVPTSMANKVIELNITGGVFMGGSDKGGNGYYGAVVVTDEAMDALTEQKFISGGTFSSDINGFVAEGKVVYPNDNTYTVIEGGKDQRDEDSSVAQVGTKYYDSLQDAIDAAQAGVGDTVKLLRKIEATESDGSPTENFYIKKQIILDLAGSELDLGTGSNISILRGAGNVIIKDTGSSKGKIISSGLFSTVDVSGPDSSLTLNGVTIEYIEEEFSIGGAISVDYASVIVENGSEITAKMKDSPYMGSGAVELGLDGKLTVSGGTIRATGKNSLAIRISGVDMEWDTTTVNISNGIIEAADGYAIYNARHSKINISGGTITGLAGIVARSGEIKVTNGTVKATGTEKMDNGYGADDYSLFPAGIVFDERPPLPVGENAGVTITGGKIVAADGQHSLVYTKAGDPPQDMSTAPFTIAEGSYFLSGEKGDAYVKGYLADGLTIDGTTGKVIKAGSSRRDGVYTITFDANGGKLNGSATAETNENGKLTTMPADPSRDGFVFDAWYTAKEGGYVVNSAYTFTRDTTVYALWKEKTGGGTTGGDNPGGDNPGGGTGGGSTGGGTGSGGGTTGGGNTSGDNTAYSIRIASGIRHGTVSTSHASAEKGTWVTLTVSPETDYAVDWLDVEAENGQSISLSQSGKRYSFSMPASNVTVDAKFSLLAAYNKFIPPQSQVIAQPSAPTIAFTPITWRPAAAMRDVPARSWAYPAAQWAYQNGYLDTASDGTFRLEDTVPHIQLWKIMARWLGEPAWDDNSASQWARKSGAAKIGSASSAMTRQNVVEYLYQCYFLMGGDVSVTGNLIQYLDNQQITSTSARNAWLWAVNKGIITGTPEGYLNPSGVLSRGEFAAILMRLCQKG